MPSLVMCRNLPTTAWRKHARPFGQTSMAPSSIATAISPEGAA
jgi:hypothetical protein